MPMKPLREVAEERVAGGGNDPFDDELLSSHAQREGRAVLEQANQPEDQRVDRAGEQGMAGWIDRVLVQRDRQLDEEVGQIARQRRAFALGGGVGVGVRHGPFSGRVASAID
jgi:hypothetical protein